MKYILPLSLIILLACNSADKKEGVDVAGAWKMVSQTMKSDSTDTTTTSLQQLKIFTGDHMMYANFSAADSSSSFGVGTYEVAADTVKEHVFYSSTDSTKDDTVRTYSLFIEKTAKGYKQAIPDIFNPADGKHYKLNEEYESAGAASKTPLDGIWKLSMAIVISGDDTTAQTLTHYKAIYGGHVIWGHTIIDSLNKTHTGIGFGEFEMTSDTKAKEKMISSTYPVVRGQTYDLDIVMNGKDEFMQTVIEKDGTKGIETYQRLKKQ